MCDIYAMVGSLCGCASIWTMTAIALDRYNVIVRVCVICFSFYVDIVNICRNMKTLINILPGYGRRTTHYKESDTRNFLYLALCCIMDNYANVGMEQVTL